MTRTSVKPLLVAVPLWMNFGRAAAISEPQICYILDGILFLYGLILTALYCRIRVQNARNIAARKQKPHEKTNDPVYTGLTTRNNDTYETIGMKK